MAEKSLQFVKNGGVWEAEATVNDGFNIHLERSNKGWVEVYQRTTSAGKFTKTRLPDGASYDADEVYDEDFDGLVFPKTIRIKSYSEVITGTITEIE